MALAVKNSPAGVRDTRDSGLIPGSGRSPERGHGNPLQYSCLENSMDRGAWQAGQPGVTKLNMTEHAHTYTLHIVILGWRKSLFRSFILSQKNLSEIFGQPNINGITQLIALTNLCLMMRWV